MSSNSFINLTPKVLREQIKAIMNSYAFLWSEASTLGEKEDIETLFIEDALKFLNDHLVPIKVEKGTSSYADELSAFYKEADERYKLVRIKLLEVFRIYNKLQNQYSVLRGELDGKVRRIQQKRSALSLWDNHIKYVLAESFNVLDNLILSGNKDSQLRVDTRTGSATLPEASRAPVLARSVVIAAGSNGIPGNSDDTVQRNIQDPMNMFKNDENLWFEYERIGTGPCVLNLEIDLLGANIINCISIDTINFASGSNTLLTDISFKLNGKSTKLKEVYPFLKRGILIESESGIGHLELKCLPVLCDKVVLSLRQDQSYKIKSNGKNKDRFSIGIKSLEFSSIKYLNSGTLSSTDRNIPAGLFIAEPFVTSWPSNTSLYSWELATKFSKEQELTLSKMNQDAPSIPLRGDGDKVAWTINLKRNDTLFSQVSLWAESQAPTKNISSLLKTVNRLNSPARISLKENPRDGVVFAMQPNLLKRGNSKPIKIGIGIDAKLNIRLPVDILSETLEVEKLHIYVNGIEQDFALGNDPAAGQWSISEDYKTLILPSNVSANSSITFSFDKEDLLFEETPNGFYHKMEFLFDPDKKNISIKGAPKTKIDYDSVLQPDALSIKLPFTSVDQDSIIIKAEDGTLYTSVASRNLLANPGEYYADAKNGILHFFEKMHNSRTYINLKHMHPKDLKDDEYDIVYEGVKPVGIIIHPNVIEAREVTDVLFAPLPKVFNMQDFSFSEREDDTPGNNYIMTLSNKRIVKNSVRLSDGFLSNMLKPIEVPYKDGKTEFLGLIRIEKEKTVAIENTANKVTFNLAAGSAFYPEYGVVFSDTDTFATEVGSVAAVNSAGKYHISNTGTVTVYCTTVLPENKNISYYYRDPDYEPRDKYSIDYLKGRLYAYEAISAGASVTYKVAQYTAEYSIAKEVDDYSFDVRTNMLSINTERFEAVNNQCKILWEKSALDNSLKDYIEYYTPSINLIGYRFA